MKKPAWFFVASALLVLVLWLWTTSTRPSRAREEGDQIVKHIAEIRAQGQPLPKQLDLDLPKFNRQDTRDSEEKHYTLRCYVVARTSVVYFSDNHSPGFNGWFLDKETGELAEF